MKNYTEWHGISGNNRANLLSHNLLVKHIPGKQSWKCLYKVSEQPAQFAIGIITEEQIENIFQNEWIKSYKWQFLYFVRCNPGEWQQLPIGEKLYHLNRYFDLSPIFIKNETNQDLISKTIREVGIAYSIN